jgi:hypothetical protein
MKAISRLALVASMILGVSVQAQAAKKKPVDLTEFRGNYSGTITLSVSGMLLYSGTANLAIAVPKNGKSATVTTTGALLFNGSGIPFSNTFTFSQGGGYLSQNILLGLEGTGSPETGSYKVNKRQISYFARFISGSTTGSTSGSLSVRPKGRKQTLQFNNTLTADGQSIVYVIDFQASRKLKKSEQ